MTDCEVMENTIAAVSEAVCHVIDRGWRLSHHATLVALSRVLMLLALEHLRAHPTDRAAIVALLRDLLAGVECEAELPVQH